MFYVYEWYNVNTQEIFYVGKGTGNRFKQVSQRNALFKQYYEANECATRIIETFQKEEEAFVYEHQRIVELKAQNQCFCNLDNGGTGGVNFIWTPEMRKYKSIYNPMKEKKQRERMSFHNPMYNKKISEKVGKANSKIVCYQNRETTCREIANEKNIHIATVQRWCKRGYDTDGNSCYYKGEYVAPNKKITSSKAILIDGNWFPSLRAGADFLGVKDTSPLCKALKTTHKYKGHICEYANQQPSDTNSDKSSIEGSTTNG